jgi:hypothetical protein
LDLVDLVRGRSFGNYLSPEFQSNQGIILMGMDREKWLAIRNTPRKVGNERYIHVSAEIRQIENPITKKKYNIRGKGDTFRRTQNKG